MDEINMFDKDATVEPVQGHLIEVLTVIDGVGPIYRPTLGFHDLSIQHESAVPPSPAKR